MKNDKFRFNIQLFGGAGEFTDPDDEMDNLGAGDDTDLELEDDSEIDPDSDTEDLEDDSVDNSKKKPKQTKEDNSAARKARLQAEAEAKAKQDAFAKMYGYDSFEEMESAEKQRRQKEADAQLQKEAEGKGVSVEDLKAQKKRNEYLDSQIQKDEEARRIREFALKDRLDFERLYPNVSIGALENNEKFRKFAGERFGKVPLADLYGTFIDIVGDQITLQKNQSKNERSTGSGSSTFKGLSESQSKRLADWNKKNPNMQMTAKEFKELGLGG